MELIGQASEDPSHTALNDSSLGMTEAWIQLNSNNSKPGRLPCISPKNLRLIVILLPFALYQLQAVVIRIRICALQVLPSSTSP